MGFVVNPLFLGGLQIKMNIRLSNQIFVIDIFFNRIFISKNFVSNYYLCLMLGLLIGLKGKVEKKTKRFMYKIAYIIKVFFLFLNIFWFELISL